jgi:hypothetical protein
LKNDVNVPSKRNKQKNRNKLFFVGILKVWIQIQSVVPICGRLPDSNAFPVRRHKKTTQKKNKKLK